MPLVMLTPTLSISCYREAGDVRRIHVIPIQHVTNVVDGFRALAVSEFDDGVVEVFGLRLSRRHLFNIVVPGECILPEACGKVTRVKDVTQSCIVGSE